MTNELENNEKICVPLLFHENLFVTGFRGEAEFFFVFFFAKLCSLINSDSSLPSEIIKKIVNSVCSVRFSREDILKINILDSNRTHAHG